MDSGDERRKGAAGKVSTYAAAGVDVERAERSLGGLLEWIRKTASFRDGIGEPVLDIGYYANVIRLTDTLGLAISTDGVGTKLLLAQQLDRLEGVGFDCVAMNVNDILCVGAEPLAMVDYLAVEDAEPGMLSRIGESLYRAAREARIVIPGGELAQVREMLRGRVEGRAFDLVGTCVGTVSLDRILVGDGLRSGDAVIGIASSGLHSNGFTLARRVVEASGWPLDRTVEDLGRSLGEALLEPTVIYVPHVDALKNAKVRPKALLHITGDGFLNLVRVKSPVSFVLDALPDPPPIFRTLAALGRVPDEEMYATFNMGVGFCVVSSAEETDACLGALRGGGWKAWRIGEVVADGRREVRLPRKSLVGRGKSFRKE